jgi:hypothetical protein
MKITNDGIFYFLAFVAIILFFGEPDLIDAIIYRLMK